jgi:hypothetical protein
MNINQQVSLTLRLVWRAPLSHWSAYAALFGMLVTIGAMVAMMWFLSSRPTSDLTAWLCGALSVSNMLLWRAMLAHAHAHALAEDQAR